MLNNEIYLDSNIYISIAKREKNHEYTLAKINNLYKTGIIFPHAPPHAEEISARIINNREPDIAKKFFNLVIKFNRGFGYRPGFSNKKETEEIIWLFQNNEDYKNAPEAQKILNIFKGNLKKINLGLLNEGHFKTLLEKDDFNECLTRVDRHLDLTEYAKKNEIYHLGRRNKKKLTSNFEKIGKSSDNITTFEELHKRYKIGPNRLSKIPPEKIFDDANFAKFLKDQDINIDKIPTGDELSKSHHQKEIIITLILNVMEKAGYNQEEKNHEATLTGRMHDISHAIYASRAKYFVTNDIRFSKKVIATYMKLKISTRVITTEEFLTI
jgi:hypothetical protein